MACKNKDFAKISDRQTDKQEVDIGFIYMI
jgi:hypothetical protein